jgi:hypothetical protein
MDLLRMQNSMDEILSLVSQSTSPQVHARIAELLHTLLNVSLYTIIIIFCFCASNKFEYVVEYLK